MVDIIINNKEMKGRAVLEHAFDKESITVKNGIDPTVIKVLQKVFF